MENLLNPSAVGVPIYLKELTPYRNISIKKLEDRFDDEDKDQVQRLHAAYGLEHLSAAENRHRDFILNSLLWSTLSKSEGPNIVAALDRWKDRDELRNRLTKLFEPTTKKRDSDVERRANAVLRNRILAVSLALGFTKNAADVCRLKADPSQRTSFIHSFKNFPAGIRKIPLHVDLDADRDLRSALAAAIGSMDTNSMEPDEVENAVSMLDHWYRKAPDGGTHSAAGWALRKWDRQLPAITVQSMPDKDADWYVNALGIKMIRVEGKMRLGDVTNNKNPKMSDPEKSVGPVWVADREVSLGLFKRFVNAKNKTEWTEYFNNENGQQYSPTDEHPVVYVSWNDAAEFCNWLTDEVNKRRKKQEMASLRRCYQKSGDEWQPVDSGNGYRLLTEEEWEFSCRAMSTRDFYLGQHGQDGQGGELSDYATWNASSATECGSNLPNGFGLFDMHGNVWEWCNDWSTYPRVLRGGSFGSSDPWYLRSARRDVNSPGDRFDFGFRVSRTP